MNPMRGIVGVPLFLEADANRDYLALVRTGLDLVWEGDDSPARAVEDGGFVA